ncbi:MAG: hypothetical protein IKR22_03805 [Clostridiales bacterium]|nr:hypothetical protein [Clostridiales bacterium]
MFENGFPMSLRGEVEKVISVMSKVTYNGVFPGVSDDRPEDEEYVLSDRTRISFPYRIYYLDDNAAYAELSDIEKLIYDCIYTRSCDGRVREKHIRSILAADFPEWCFPYILKLSSEYVVEILSVIYDALKERDNSDLWTFSRENPEMLQLAYRRMVSYWNEFYRKECPMFKDYVGRILFKECLATKTNLEKIH